MKRLPDVLKSIKIASSQEEAVEKVKAAAKTAGFRIASMRRDSEGNILIKLCKRVVIYEEREF